MAYKKKKRRSAYGTVLLAASLLAVACALFLLVSLFMKPASSGEVAERTMPENQYSDELFYELPNGMKAYNGGSSAGIDVSEHQGEIDWQQVAASGVDFAIIRVGYRGSSDGGLYEDACFRENIAGASAAGLRIGVYFFSQAITPEEAEEEAAFTAERIASYAIAYPVYYDWETVAGGARTDAMTAAEVTECVRAFCNATAAYGYRGGVYFNQYQGYEMFDIENLQEYSFWLASYSEEAEFYYHFDIWQYATDGTIPGINGSVDWNICLTKFGEEES